MLESERIESPEEELKRADHLVFVSLKYTRTCDVMKNAIKRMIAAFELAFDEYLEEEKLNKTLEELPTTAKEKMTLMKDLLGSQGRKYFILYNLLKKIDKAEYVALEEFRKNVTLRVDIGKPLDIKMTHLNDYLKTTREFVAFLRQKQK